ncbi:hypothetical protein ONZ45_g16947 [Pleurotus djamor]|nr:hypothetical protein ONZ45_g16947 [Pleurotus djamor]
MLADVHQKFISRLVKRYPLIFGLWGRGLKQEATFFSPIARSISNIISRSPNQTFRNQATTLINKLRERHASSVTASTSALSQYLGDKSLTAVASSSPHLGTEESICSALTILYKSGTTRPQFRPTELAAQEKDDVLFTEAAHDTGTLQATPSPDQPFLDLPIADEDAPDVPLLSLAGPGPTKEQYDALLWMLGLPDPNDSQVRVDVLESPPSPFHAPSSPAKNPCSSANPPDNDCASLAHLSYPVQSATDGSVLLNADGSHQDVSLAAAVTASSVPDDDDENVFCIDIDDDGDEDEDKDALDYCEMDICLAAFDMDMDVDTRPKKQEPEMTFLMDSDSDGLEEFDEDEDMASVSISPRSSSIPSHEGLALQHLTRLTGGSAGSEIKHCMGWEEEETQEDDMFLINRLEMHGCF